MAKKVILSKKQKELLANRGYWERIHKEEYLETDKNLKEMAKFLGFSLSKLIRIFKFLGLRAKTIKECSRVRYGKSKKTNLERYGVENASQSEVIKEKIKKTTMKNHGVEHYMHSKELREKAKKTNLERYGVENASQLESVKEKIKKTNIKRYGCENPMQSKVVREKGKKTNIERLGVEYPTQSKEVKGKVKKTMLERYGVENPFQLESVKERIRESRYDRTLRQLNNWCGGNGYLFLDVENFNGVFDYNEQGNYIGWATHSFKHLECGKEFKQTLRSSKEEGYQYIKCPHCYPQASVLEIKYRQFIADLGIKADYNRRDIISPYEIDIFLPDCNIAIEINGDYWHSEERIQERNGMSSKEYHQMKTDRCIEKDIILHHIWESDSFTDWINKIKSWFNNG